MGYQSLLSEHDYNMIHVRMLQDILYADIGNCNNSSECHIEILK